MWLWLLSPGNGNWRDWSHHSYHSCIRSFRSLTLVFTTALLLAVGSHPKDPWKASRWYTVHKFLLVMIVQTQPNTFSTTIQDDSRFFRKFNYLRYWKRFTTGVTWWYTMNWYTLLVVAWVHTTGINLSVVHITMVGCVQRTTYTIH